MIGVYKITNTINGKVYIGSTAGSFERRWSEHRSRLRHGSHGNRHLQSAWNKYSESAFVFEILEATETGEEACARELYWIGEFYGKNCYNSTNRVRGRPETKSYTHEEFLTLLRKVETKLGLR